MRLVGRQRVPAPDDVDESEGIAARGMSGIFDNSLAHALLLGHPISWQVNSSTMAIRTRAQ
jgi:hypothetical protein